MKQGVPPIFAKGYIDAEKQGKEKTLENLDHYWKTVYHTPQDEYKPGRNDLSGVVQDAQLLYKVGLNLANSQEWPK